MFLVSSDLNKPVKREPSSEEEMKQELEEDVAVAGSVEGLCNPVFVISGLPAFPNFRKFPDFQNCSRIPEKSWSIPEFTVNAKL